MKYVYHYYAHRRVGNEVTEIDGLLYCDIPIDSMTRYREVKATIVEFGKTERVVIRSLSLLGTTERERLEDSHPSDSEATE